MTIDGREAGLGAISMKNLMKLSMFGTMTGPIAGSFLVQAMAGCADFSDMPVTPGEPAEAVRATLGRPSGVYRAGPDTLLEYAKGPTGQVTYMARIGPDQRLLSYEQVLTSAKFARIRPGVDTMESVLIAFGRPAEKLRLAHPPYDVWAYRYKEQNVWDSMMYVHFDQAGVVRKVINGPDPERDERWR